MGIQHLYQSNFVLYATGMDLPNHMEVSGHLRKMPKEDGKIGVRPRNLENAKNQTHSVLRCEMMRMF